MKKNFFILLCVSFLCSATIVAQERKQISKDKAWEIVQTEVLGEQCEKVNVYVTFYHTGSEILKDNSSAKNIMPKYDSWFFFIDDKPFESWSHPCRYVFVNANSGAFVVHQMNRPPLIEQLEPIIEQKIVNAEKECFKFNKNRSLNPTANPIYSSNHEYAVIISGGVDNYYNWERYWNHCSSMYQALVNIYGYSKDHIYVLMSDGTDPGFDLHMINGTYMSSPLDLDGDGSDDIQYAATHDNIEMVFNLLSNTLTNQDNLFIFTTDHGGLESGQQVYMDLWNYEVLYDYEFSSYLNQLNANFINICMGQCHSGGFIDDITRNNVAITTACNYDESAFARPNYQYSYFVYNWLSAVTGETPDGTIVNADANNDGFVSMHEAFLYAEMNNLQIETTQYMSTPSALGDGVYLACPDSFQLSGPNTICDSASYRIIPTCYGTLWSINNQNDFTITPNGSQCKVEYTGLTPTYSIANLTPIINYCGTFQTSLTKRIVMHGTTLNVTGWQYGGLITPNGIFPDRTFSIPSNKGLITIPVKTSMDELFEEESLPIDFIEDNSLKGPHDPVDLCGYGITEINGGNMVYLNSTRFNGMDISFSGFYSPTSFNHSGNNITFEMPYNSSDYPVVLQAHSDAQCHDFCLTFNVVPLPGAASGNDMIWVNLDGSMLYVTFMGVGEPIGNGQYYLPSYSVTINKIPSGIQVYSNTFPGSQNTFSVNTSSWSSGMYSIKIVHNGHFYSKTISL